MAIKRINEHINARGSLNKYLKPSLTARTQDNNNNNNTIASLPVHLAL